jgi:hypothetical protein
MTHHAPDCIRCRNRMVAGYLLEAGDHNARTVTQWVEGAPEKNFWTGLKLKNRDVMAVSTYRCPNCGYLESYAQEQPKE